MVIMEKDKDDQGIFSAQNHIVNLGGVGGSPYLVSEYPTHNKSYYPVHGYPAPAPPPGAYSVYAYGEHFQLTPERPHVPAGACSATANYPHNYGVYGAGAGAYEGYGKHQQQYNGGYEGYGKHQQQHVDYYHRHEEEFDTYQQEYGGHNKYGYSHGYGGLNNHGYGHAYEGHNNHGYSHGYDGHNNHGYGKNQFGIKYRGISDAKV